MSIAYGHPTPGMSTIFFASTGVHLRYRCDPVGHQIVVSDESGAVVRTFGGFGRKAGALDTPLDLVFVRPEFAGERLPMDAGDTVWVAVADYGNRRVQVFELDGRPVGEVSLDAPDGTPWVPTGLAWRSPVLEVEGLDGARTAVHLSAALLAGNGRTGDRRTMPGSEARH